MIKLSQKITLVLFVFCANFANLKAQEKSTKLSTDLSTLIDNSNSFKEYKVIDKGALTSFQASLNSYVKQEQSIQMNIENEIKANEKVIQALEKEMKSLKTTNEKLMNDKANIAFFGFSVSKENYSVIMWTLFLVSLTVAVILFLSFKKANRVTKESKSLLADLEEEYQSYRGVCVEREQNLRRQLFDKVKKQ
jgi:biopolymer transport protein ExbB/TolQ